MLMWSVLHYPAGVVPITSVTEEETTYVADDGHNDLWTKGIRKDLVGSAGMPVGVQVVSRKWDDEVALGVMKAID